MKAATYSERFGGLVGPPPQTRNGRGQIGSDIFEGLLGLVVLVAFFFAAVLDKHKVSTFGACALIGIVLLLIMMPTFSVVLVLFNPAFAL